MQEKADPLTQTGPSLERELVHQKLYIIGNKLGQTKTGGEEQEEHTYNFPRRLNSASQGRARGPTLPSQ